MSEQPVDDGDEEFTELYDARINRIDLVGKGANGLPFLIAKSAGSGGLIDPADVRALIGDAPAPTVLPATAKRGTDDVTITGTPAAITKMIHEAALRARTTNEEDVMGDVAKADTVEVAAPDEALPDADEIADGLGGTLGDFAEGDPADPGSAAWEAVDAARARQAIDLTLALRRLLEDAQCRETQEAAVGDGDGADMALGDALCALDCVLSILAPFAVEEEAEAADRVAEREALAKGQVRVAKAGRVLSSANENRVRQASSLLQEVLASLPAPVETDTTGVAKEGAAVEPSIIETAGADAAEVAKAKGDPQMAVFDGNGKLVGTIDPGDLSPIAATEPPAGGEAEGDGDGADAAPEAAADAAEPAPAPATDADLEPAPAPGGAVADSEDVQKGADSGGLEAVVKAAMEGALAESPVIKALRDELEALKAPESPRVLAHGVPLPGHLVTRGQQSAGASPAVDVAKAAALKSRFDSASTVEERETVAKELQELASTMYWSMRADRARGA